MSVKPSLIILGIVLSVFLFSGCATHEITAESPEPESGEDNAWYKPVVDEAEYFIGLNLDGAGDHDDQAVVTTYRWEGSLEDCYTLLSIRLGTGKVLSRGFRGWMDFTFQTGHLSSREKESIVLEISSKASNYCAATVYVLEIGEDDPGVFLSEPVIVGDFSYRPKLTNCMDVPLLTIGTTILEGGPDELDKVQLFEIDIDRPSDEDIPHTLAWNGAEWTYD